MPASTYPPSVDALARRLAQQREFDRLPRTMLVDAVRSAVATAPSEAESTAVDLARLATRRLLTSVINGTGTLLHTNLGRSPRPLPTAVADRVRATTIELDLATGERGSRHGAVAELLVDLTGAEATVVVNNCAAGLVLVLAALAHGRGVVISRGELVEIGGGFRIPDIIEQSGCRLIEVGTTNRTRLADYQRAIESNDVAVVLKVHPSNYRITGFTEEVGIATLATLGLPVIGDLGTGLLDASTPWLADASGQQPNVAWIRQEPSVREWLSEGADVVIVSGDKLLGGPQSGLVLGRTAIVATCAGHPLMRPLRAGTLVMEALQETLVAYGRNDARSLPFWEQATRSIAELRGRATELVDAIAKDQVRAAECSSTPGGGTMPNTQIASYGVRISGSYVDALRGWSVPIIARGHDGATWIDLRTVDPADDEVVLAAIRAINFGL